MKRLIAILACIVLPAFAQLPPAPANMLEWPLPWNDTVPGLMSADSLIAKPAGKDGFVVARDGHFFAGQTRVRFWGVNIAFSGCFPKHDDADAIAKRLARFGYNSVRLHHMDMQPFPNGIFTDNKLDTLSPEALERLDYFISALKREGIYSNINLHVSRWYSKAQKWPGADKTESFDKIVDIFYPPLIDVQKKYARDLLGHVNAYTKLRYSDDPAVAIVEINNENSIFMWGSDQHLGELPEPFAAELKKQWNVWLVSQYTTRDKLAAAWNAGLEKDGPNIVTDPNCESFGKPGSKWVTEIRGGAKMAISREDGGAKVAVSAAADPFWNLQFNCVPVSLKKGQIYAVRFMARTDKPGARYTVGTQQAHEPWESMGLSGTFNPTADWKEYQFGFKAAQDDDRVKLSFCPGYQVTTLWLKNIQLFTGGQVGLRADEDLTAGSVAVTKKGQPLTAPRLRDWHKFLQAIDESYFVGMYNFVKKDLGVKCAVTGTIAYGPMDTISQSRMDFVDQHSYWEHPHFPHRQWDMNDWVINNKPMSDSAQGGTMPGLISTRVLGKPYTVTEYQHGAPNEWQAECMPMIAALAAAQDWDGIFIFSYTHNQDYKRARMNSFFDIEGNPAKMAPSPLAARLFLGGAVPPLAGRIVVRPDFTQSLDNVARYWTDMKGYVSAFHGVTGQKMLGAQFGLTYDPAAKVGETGGADPRWQWTTSGPGSGRFSFGDDRAVVFTGFPGAALTIGPVTLEKLDSPFATLIIVPANRAQTIAQADKLLICAIGRCDNVGVQWDAKRQTIGSRWGNGAPRIEPVKATLKLASTGTYTLKSLDASGQPMGDGTPITAGTITLPGDSPWYVMERR